MASVPADLDTSRTPLSQSSALQSSMQQSEIQPAQALAEILRYLTPLPATQP